MGNRLGAGAGLTSARWQVLAALALAGRPLTVAQIARTMGLSRQSVQRLVDEARAGHVAVTTVTETLTPKGATFQEWQTRQLHALRAALATATGR